MLLINKYINFNNFNFIYLYYLIIIFKCLYILNNLNFKLNYLIFKYINLLLNKILKYFIFFLHSSYNSNNQIYLYIN